MQLPLWFTMCAAASSCVQQKDRKWALPDGANEILNKGAEQKAVQPGEMNRSQSTIRHTAASQVE